MATCEACNDPVEPGSQIVTAGGWCAPPASMYEIPVPDLCSDCSARSQCIQELGIDPGRHGENLRVRRGGIRYGVPDA